MSRVSLSKQFAMLSKQILDLDLRKNEHRNAFKFLQNVLNKLIITENFLMMSILFTRNLML